MADELPVRTIVKTASTPFGKYHWQPEKDDISFLALSYQGKSAQGAYIMRMQPGAETEWHTHGRREEYLVIEGDLVESDGTVLGPGDFVIYQPGSGHNSRTVNGCVLLGIDYSWSDSAPDRGDG